MFNTLQAKLEDQLERGAISDLIAVEEAMFLLDCFDPHCDAINEAGFGHLISVFQRVLLDQVILVGARLFEREKGYPLRNLPSATKLLRDHAEQIPIRFRGELSDCLPSFGIEPEVIASLPDAALTRYWTDHCTQLLREHSLALKPLIDQRNKRVAHREQVEDLSGVEWTVVHRAIDFAKSLVTTIDHGYLSNSYKENKAYPLTEGAKIASRSMLRLLRQANVLPGD